MTGGKGGSHFMLYKGQQSQYRGEVGVDGWVDKILDQ